LRLHVTFLLLLGVIGYETFAEAGLRGSFWALTLVCAIFACIALHELGHSVVAQQLGVQVKSITLLPIGGVAALRNIPENPWHEIAITLAGPMVNAAIAVVLLPFTGLPSRLFLVMMPHDLAGLVHALATVNLGLFLFNLLPAFPMDGGRLLRAVLALAISYRDGGAGVGCAVRAGRVPSVAQPERAVADYHRHVHLCGRRRRGENGADAHGAAGD
jgi:stage IV sporulation protein FB